MVHLRHRATDVAPGSSGPAAVPDPGAPKPPKIKKTRQYGPRIERFRQQTLHYYNWVLIPRRMLPLLTLLFLICLPIGLAYLVTSRNTHDVRADYTQCATAAPATRARPQPGQTTTPDTIDSWAYNAATGQCTLFINVPAMSAPVHWWIQFTNFYQNHRLFVGSVSYKQLRGDDVANAEAIGTIAVATPTCGWLQYANCNDASAKDQSRFNMDCLRPEAERDAVIRNAAPGAQYYPCGLIANSFFTDEFTDLTCAAPLDPAAPAGACTPASTYAFSTDDITWASAKDQFRPPGRWASESDATIRTNLIPPPMWRAAWPERYGDGYNASTLTMMIGDPRFQNWMRPEGQPTFRKLWGKNASGALAAGTYQMVVTSRYDVARFNGTKSIVFGETTWYGQRNYTLSILYLIGAAAALLLALMMGIHMFCSKRKIGDPRFLSWNRQ
ncbi:hypothetical protein CXG81DRAFT_10226 [Caulochytrium protostelioides]|uniref:Lem3/Cdc50 n=1 Tax=Caulochytrium protostelioides TaxID=1555241 RepID=A0A4P9XBS0_9FUNG|nr:hypothetical protein CXG81DRAFT_10226 [Caulochytrium protostelioides]|eukprot:RKP02877.1 hypothetical protein CXG81DRAFT_10226 [Caulochytrium protostelioides]